MDYDEKHKLQIQTKKIELLKLTIHLLNHHAFGSIMLSKYIGERCPSVFFIDKSDNVRVIISCIKLKI